MKPLQHLTILDLSRVLACPFASMILAELGATVIKVEQPGMGDPYRQMVALAPINYAWLLDARNKRGITLNLKTDEGRDILMRLVTDCDVYVTNQPLPLQVETEVAKVPKKKPSRRKSA